MKLFFLFLFCFSTLFAVDPVPLDFTITRLSPIQLSAFELTSEDDQFTNTIDTDPAGNSIAVWNVNRNGNIALQTAFKPAGAAGWLFPSVNQFITPPDISVTDFDIQMDESGNAVLVWIGFTETLSGVIQAAYMPATTPGTFQPFKQLAFGVNLPPRVAIAGGNVIVAWSTVNTDPRIIPPIAQISSNVVQAAYKLSAGDWVTPGLPTNSQHNLSVSSPFRPFLTVSTATLPQVAVDVAGNMAVVWQMSSDLLNTLVAQVATKRPLEDTFSKPGDPASTSNPNNLGPLARNVTDGPFVTIGTGNINIMWQAALILPGSAFNNNLTINSATAQF